MQIPDTLFAIHSDTLYIFESILLTIDLFQILSERQHEKNVHVIPPQIEEETV